MTSLGRRFLLSMLSLPALLLLGQTRTRPAPENPPGKLSLQEVPRKTATQPATEEEAKGGSWIWPRHAVDTNLVPDRPGFSDCTGIVAQGHVQIEGGYTITYDREDRSPWAGRGPGRRIQDHTFPEFSLRTGFTDDLELRVKWAGGYSITETLTTGTTRAGRRVGQETTDHGARDLSLGFKYLLIDSDRFDLAVIPQMTVPSGSASKTSGDVDPSLELAWSYALTPKWSVYGIVVGGAVSDLDGHFGQAAASLATFYQWTDRVGLFAEYFGIYPNSPDSDCAHNVDGGFTVLIDKNMQLDFRVGMGLNEEAPDVFAGAGFAIRW